MFGNVSEWCQDVYQANYYEVSASANPRGRKIQPNKPNDPCEEVPGNPPWTCAVSASAKGSKQGIPMPAFSPTIAVFAACAPSRLIKPKPLWSGRRLRDNRRTLESLRGMDVTIQPSYRLLRWPPENLCSCLRPGHEQGPSKLKP